MPRSAGAAWTRTARDAVRYTSEWTASAGAAFTEGAWRFSLDLQQVSAQESGNLRFPGASGRLDGYLLASGRIARLIQTTGLEILVAGENLDDVDCAYRPGYPMPGRDALTSVSWNF